MNIYTMKLHETFNINVGGPIGEMAITKVAGGWIYTHARLDHKAMTSVFVPYTDEEPAF